MASSSTKQFADAILSNKLALVASLLDAGAKANGVIDHGDTDSLHEQAVRDGDFSDHVKFAFINHCTICRVFPLHLAIVNLYHSSKSEGQSWRALKILDVLLSRGAEDCFSCSDNLMLCNIEGFRSRPFNTHSANTAVDLALFLKNHPIRDYEDATRALLKTGIKKIQRAMAKKGITESVAKTQIKTTPIMSEIAKAWSSILFSEKFSDIAFLCSDGESVPAHRNVLAASSPYFATALDGPWQEATSGKWTTAYSSSLIRAVLTLIYTGHTPEEFKTIDAVELLQIVSEYDIQPAIKIATELCIENLQVNNVKRVLQAAHLHQNNHIKEACFRFVKENAVRVLIEPEFAALSTEDAGLWSELKNVVSPDTENEEPSTNKRARLN